MRLFFFKKKINHWGLFTNLSLSPSLLPFFGVWSKVLQTEALISKIGKFSLDIFQLLQSSNENLPEELSSTSLEVMTDLRFMVSTLFHDIDRPYSFTIFPLLFTMEYKCCEDENQPVQPLFFLFLLD